MNIEYPFLSSKLNFRSGKRTRRITATVWIKTTAA